MWLEAYQPMIRDALGFFLFVVAELSVLFVLITFLVYIIQELLPAEKIKAVMSGRHGRGYVIGAGLGALTPFCSCSTIPLTIGLLKARSGFGPTMSFLYTSPLVNPMIVALLWMALGVQFTLIYATMAIGLAVVVAFLLERFGFERFIKQDILTPDDSPATVAASSLTADDVLTEGFTSAARRLFSNRARMRELLWKAVQEYRKFLPYILVAVALGAIMYGFIPEDFLISYASADNPLAVPFSAVIGVPLYLRGSILVPMIMPLAAKGVSLGAIAALIIGSAGASIPEVVMLNRMFRLPMIAAFLVSVLSIAIITGFVFNAVYG